jgi:hypothetical protein
MKLARKSSNNIFHAISSAVIGRIEMPQCSDLLQPVVCYLHRMAPFTTERIYRSLTFTAGRRLRP